MNNNMPNNLNNGMPNNANPVNNMPDPAVTAANSELMGGQGPASNTPNVMQGMPNVPNEGSVMQGISNVPNNQGAMTGVVSPEPVAEPTVMPGQGNSGINAMTMQVEEPKPEEPGVVSIPSFAPNIPEQPTVEPPMPEPQQMPNPNMNANPMANNPLTNPMSAPDVNIINGPAMPQMPEQPLNPGMNDIPTNNIIGNGMPNVNMAPPVNNIGMNPTPNLNNQIGEPNVNQGISQVGQTELNSIDNDLAEMPDMPEKKFPLSVREMVLIGIALVGIVIVLIVYLK